MTSLPRPGIAIAAGSSQRAAGTTGAPRRALWPSYGMVWRAPPGARSGHQGTCGGSQGGRTFSATSNSTPTLSIIMSHKLHTVQCFFTSTINCCTPPTHPPPHVDTLGLGRLARWVACHATLLVTIIIIINYYH